MSISIEEIKKQEFIDINLDATELCSVCKSFNKIPCDHKIAVFRTRDRVDDIVDALNGIIRFLNDKSV